MSPLALAVAFSIGIIALLWWSDPKRRRIAGLPDSRHGSIRRRLMFAALLIPGVVLAVSGDSAAFLVWFGSCAVGGWLITVSTART